MIRPAVYKLLKYRGSFRQLITSTYFIGQSQTNEWFYNSSQKVPFYFIHDASPKIQAPMMAKYLENAFNPFMVVRYNQQVPNFKSLECTDRQMERTISIG